MNIIAWSQVVPWAETRQVEQDLIISRIIVEIFADSFLRESLRFHGGTALNKLHFAMPYRYSEDIDLVRTSHGHIGPILNRIRELVEPWLGASAFDQSPVAPKLRFRVKAEDQDASPIRLKVEINTRETEAFDRPALVPYAVDNPWFSGNTEIATFSREEMLATKLRALLQRDKGRDLLDLAHALDVFDELNIPRVVECFQRYLDLTNTRISRAEAEQRMFAKFRNPAFLTDIRPLLSASEAAQWNIGTTQAAFIKVFAGFIVQLPGASWAKSAETAKQLKLDIDL